MRLLAGFDAGQTHTRCRLSVVQNGVHQPVGEGEGPGVSHLDAPQGERRFLEAISTSAQEALKNHPDGVIQAAVVGASGIEHGTALQQRAERLVGQALAIGDDTGLTKVLVTGDERTALRGAIPEGAGILAISGTGMIVLGRDKNGHEHRCGGWGWLLDGAGSAFDLGHQGLQLTLRMADGRLPDHPLRLQIWNQMGCDSHAAVNALARRRSFRDRQQPSPAASAPWPSSFPCGPPWWSAMEEPSPISRGSAQPCNRPSISRFPKADGARPRAMPVMAPS